MNSINYRPYYVYELPCIQNFTIDDPFYAFASAGVIVKLDVFSEIEKVHKKHPDCGITAIYAVNRPEDTSKIDIWFSVIGSNHSSVTYYGFCNMGNF